MRYLHGLSSGDFGPALEQVLASVAGLSEASITRLDPQRQDEAAAVNARSLADTDYSYLWVDGIHVEVRLEQDNVYLPVMIGVRADGPKQLIAPEDGHRESSQSWAPIGCARANRGSLDRRAALLVAQDPVPPQ